MGSVYNKKQNHKYITTDPQIRLVGQPFVYQLSALLRTFSLSLSPYNSFDSYNTFSREAVSKYKWRLNEIFKSICAKNINIILLYIYNLKSCYFICVCVYITYVCFYEFQIKLLKNHKLTSKTPRHHQQKPKTTTETTVRVS